MPRSRVHRESGTRAVGTAAGNWSGWNDSLSLTGVVPPHGFDFLQRAGVNVTPKTVLSIGVVQRCLEVIQNAFFRMGPPRPYTEAYDAENYPYSVWMKRTDPAYPALLKAPWGVGPFADKAPIPYNVGCGRTIASLALFGEAWWIATGRDGRGNMRSLEVLHPAFVQEEYDDSRTQLKSVWYGAGNKRVELDPADMVYLPRLILPGDAQAVNPTRTEAPMFAIAIAAVQYSQSWFAQGATPSYVLTTDNKLDPDQIERIFEKLLLEHSGLNNMYTPLILDSGLKPEFVQNDPEKSQMNETLKYVRTEIAGYFGIPEHLVGGTGDSGNVWGKGIQEQNFSLVDFTLSGYRTPYEEALSSVLPTWTYCTVDERRLLRANDMDTAKAMLSRRTGAVTKPNEERRWLGLPPASSPDADNIEAPLTSAPVQGTDNETSSVADAPENDGINNGQ
jgi:HK97 family phage portal protein